MLLFYLLEISAGLKAALINCQFWSQQVISEYRVLDLDRVLYLLGSGTSEFALNTDIDQNMYFSYSPKPVIRRSRNRV